MYPQLLWGLLAIAIPIIVHLFNFRRFRKVTFSNVAFLKEVQQETKSKSQVKHWLILLSRCLAIACLVVAFAQPFLLSPEANQSIGKRAISIYLDNSFSMDGEGDEGRLLDAGKIKAVELVNQYNATDVFQVLTNDFEGRHQRLVSKDEAAELIEEIQLSPQTRNISEVIERQKELLKSEDFEKISYVISDLQKSTHGAEDLVYDSTLNVRFLPQKSLYPSNVYIDSIWFDTPVRALNQPENLHVRIKHNSDEVLENVPLSLVINGNQKALGSFSIAPGVPTDTVLHYTQTEVGIQQGFLKIEDYPISFDDVFYLAYEVAEQVNMLCIQGNSSGGYVPKIFEGDDYYLFEKANVSNVDYSSFKDQQLIILDQIDAPSSGLTTALESFVSNGGTVLAIPSNSADIRAYNELALSMEAFQIQGKQEQAFQVGEINLDHYIYAGAFEGNVKRMDLPKGTSYYAQKSTSNNNGETLLKLQNGQPFFSVFPHGEGNYYFLGASLKQEESNFAQHALFVPTILRVAEFAQAAQPLWWEVSDNTVVTVPERNLGSEDVVSLKALDGSLEFIPESRSANGKLELFMHDQLKRHGSFELSQGEQEIGVVSFNYSREESDMDIYDASEWEQFLTSSNWSNIDILDVSTEKVSNLVSELDEGRKLWWLFIVFAVAFLLIEIFLIKTL